MAEITYTGLLALVEQDGFQTVRRSTSRGGQYNGPCPWCGGEDRFRVQPHHGSYGWFACSQCGRRGSAIDYLIQKRGLPKQQALTVVGWKPKDAGESPSLTPAYALDERPRWNEPPVLWQRAARDFYHACQETLWSKAGHAALDYLRGRGFSDSTIERARLGYHAQECYGAAQVWGTDKPIKLWQGIVIPWIIEGKLWRLTIRNERVSSGIGRYRQISGGSNGLYLAGLLQQKRPVVIVTEGEFDALSIMQACGKEVAAVATGTTQGGHTPRWVSLLARQEQVLLAFDNEEKGESAARWWLQRLSNARRLRPLWKDTNQMLQDGADLRAWVEAGRDSFTDPALEASGTSAGTPSEDESTALHLISPSLAHLTRVSTFLSIVAELTETFRQAPGKMALDLETTGLDARRHRVVSLALGTPGKVSILDLRPYYALPPAQQQNWQQALRSLLQPRGMVWIGHNLKFDWLFLAVHFGVQLGVKSGDLYDTMLVEQVLQGAGWCKPQESVALQETAARYQIQVSKEARSWFEKLDERPEEWAAPFPPEQLRYMVQDIETPFQIAEQQTSLLERYEVRKVAELENACLPAVAAMEARGALIDRERWLQVLHVKQARRATLAQELQKTLGQALQAERQVREAEMQTYQQALREEEKRLMHLYASDVQARRQPWEAFHAERIARWKREHCEPRKPLLAGRKEPINLGSSAQVVEALNHLGIVVTSTREEVLEEYAPRYPLVAQFLAWRKLDHFCHSFGENLLAHVQEEGRIYAHFAQIGAVSGRIICSRPNLQQIPKKREQEPEGEDIRRCFIAPPGYQFLKSDLSNIELRILAEVSEDPTMLRFFAEGKDLHAETARLMFHLPPDTDTKKYLHRGVTVREIAKTINYGLSYGMGASRLAQRLNIPREDARELMRAYFATYSGVDRWLRRAGQRVRKQGYAASLAGRKRLFIFEGADQARQASMERMARNHPIQATNADILKQALSMLIDVLPEEAHLVLAVHDEIVLECPEPLIEDTERLLKAVLIEACRTYLKVVRIPEPEVLIAPYWKKE